MDTAQDINTVEWFFGYGGNHLGLKRVLPNLRLLAACEIEEFAIENILAKMEAGLLEAAPIWSDCKTFPWEPFVDRTHLFVASYPCQPFSAAGKRQGAEDERHLWPYVYRWILRARPLLVFLENVEGHISLGLSTVISDLEEGGYKAAWGVFSASEIGAPHQRKRVFILAHLIGAGLQGLSADTCEDSQGWEESNGYFGPSCLRDQQQWPSRPGEQQYEWEPPRVVADAHQHGNGQSLRRSSRPRLGELYNESTGVGNATSARCPRPEDTGADCGDEGQRTWREESERDGDMANAECELRPRWAERFGRRIGQQSEIEFDASEGRSQGNGLRQAQPSLGRDVDGSAHRLGHAELHVSTDNRTDELRLLGNGVVPATAERAFRTLLSELNSTQPHT